MEQPNSQHSKENFKVSCIYLTCHALCKRDYFGGPFIEALWSLVSDVAALWGRQHCN